MKVTAPSGELAQMWCAHETGRTRRAAAALASMITLAAAPTVHARTGSCAPVRILSNLSKLNAPWRAALEGLVSTTGREGLPWSCSGGTIELVPEASGATLTVVSTKGWAVSRHVSRPDEVAPTGEALLALPLEEPPAPASPPPGAGLSPHAAPVGPVEPRAQLQLLLGPRASGPGAMAWGSGLLRVQLPFGPWSAGVWARYDLRLAGPSGEWVNFSASSVSAGLSAGRKIVSGSFELRVSVDPSVALVIMTGGGGDENDDEAPRTGVKPVFRLGTTLSGLFPLAGAFRGVIALDGEFAPAGITGLRNIDTHNPPELPPVPVYTAGFLLGVEASLR